MRKLLNKILPKKVKLTANVIPRSEHGISRQNISENALKVLYRLNDAGYEAYLVGGCVRDLSLGLIPKDFDVATSAHPEQVKKIFRNCQLIGRRFRLAHVRFRNEIIEVATFRKDHGNKSSKKAHMEDGMIIRDNVYGKIEDDAVRRDFTINALYYTVKDFEVYDFTHGMEDLQNKMIRCIGNTEKRFEEDPMRILRAIRFMSQLDFDLSDEIKKAIPQSRHLLEKVSSARLFLDVIKAFHKGHSLANFKNLSELGIIDILFPSIKNLVKPYEKFYQKNFVNTDTRIQNNRPVTPGFLYAALLWPAVKESAQHLREHHKAYAAIESASDKIIRQQQDIVAFPKRFTVMAREIWRMQHLLCKRNPRSIFRLFNHPRFRAAFDLLCVRAQSGEKVHKFAKWWQEFQDVDTDQRQEMVENLRK